MTTVVQIIIAVAAIALFVWLLIPSKDAPAEDAVIDPTDARQIGMLIGMTGGSVTDAAVAQFALRRFEEQYGRKATVREMGIVVGLMHSMR